MNRFLDLCCFFLLLSGLHLALHLFSSPSLIGSVAEEEVVDEEVEEYRQADTLPAINH